MRKREKLFASVDKTIADANLLLQICRRKSEESAVCNSQHSNPQKQTTKTTPPVGPRDADEVRDSVREPLHPWQEAPALFLPDLRQGDGQSREHGPRSQDRSQEA